MEKQKQIDLIKKLNEDPDLCWKIIGDFVDKSGNEEATLALIFIRGAFAEQNGVIKFLEKAI